MMLTAAEESAIDRAINKYILSRAQEIKQLLHEQEPEHVATSIAL
jgi:hypothetical protein